MALVTRARVLVAATFVLTGCSAIIGVNDLFLDENAEGGTGDGGNNVDGRSNSEGGSTDAGVCNADVQADPLNCGRCGHDCLGGNCLGSVCQPVTIANGVGMAYDLAVDDKNVYYPSYYDDTITAAPKDPDGGKTILVDKWESLNSVVVANGQLFWSSDDTAGNGTLVPDGGDNNGYGGVWSCTIATGCKDRKLIHKIDNCYKLYPSGTYIFSACNDGVGRVGMDGSDPKMLSTTRAISIAADSTNAYFVTQNDVESVPINGGTSTTVGPVYFGYDVNLDETRVVWTSSLGDDQGDVGSVYAAPKSSPGNRTLFGNKNVNSAGVISDGKNIYWANGGTFANQSSNGDGQVLSCPIAGCVGDPTVVLDKLIIASYLRFDPTNENALYVMEYGGNGGDLGRVLRVAKP